MARTKRDSSPSLEAIDSRSLKRQRPNVIAEVIDISSGEDEVAPLPSRAQRKGKGKGKQRQSSTSPRKQRVDEPIEILSSRGTSPMLDSPRSLPENKGKGKARAIEPEIVDVDALPDFPQPEGGPLRLRVYEVVDSEPEDNFTSAQPPSFNADEALARRLAREWAQEDAPEPPEAPANKGSSSSKPALVPALGEPRKHSLDIPYATLADPMPTLGEFKVLLERVGQCSDCKRSLPSPRSQVILEYPPNQTEGFPPSLGRHVHATCSSRSCQEIHCRGCFSSLSCLPKCPGPIPGSSCEALSCCAEGRAIALYAVLAGFDKQYLADKATSEARALSNLELAKQTQANTVGPGGTGYSTGRSTYHYAAPLPARGRGRGRGQGRGGTAVVVHAPPATPPATSSSSEDNAAHWDRTLAIAFNVIRDLLPAPCSESPAIYDLLPHPSLASLLLSSYVPTVLAQLLRNDSVADWIARNHVYHAILGLLRRMADSELIIQVLVGRRYEIAQSQGLGAFFEDKERIIWQRDDNGATELAAPLLEHFKKLTRQSETFLQAASRELEQGSDDVEVLDGFSLCSEIIGARDDIARAMAVVGSLSPPAQASTQDDNDSLQDRRHQFLRAKKGGRGRAKPIATESFNIEKEYVAACENLAFAHVPLAKEVNGALVYAEYNYASMLSSTATGTRNPKDRLHLAKELAVMATSLPPGIWVRVDEVRNDAIKVMIAGPQGTPYAGGLFEFDVFMPLNYPNSPPLVHLRTTGKGTFRFNPNLYANGKVCLSLLGTWDGNPEEKWTSKSTLLQVLVSIQSMILNEAPYYNEPGHGKANPKSAASISYNKNVSLQTVRLAMIDWLGDEHCGGIWAPVIKSHFTIMRDKIRIQIMEWALADPSIRKYQSSSQSSRQWGQYEEVNLWGMPLGMSGNSSYLTSSVSHNANATSSASGVSSSSPRDLVEEFDAGVQRVAAWALSPDEAS